MGWMQMAKEGANKVKNKSQGNKNAMVGAAIGAGQMISGAIKKSKADRMIPSLVDPEQAALLEETRRKQRQIESGTDTLTQANLQEVEQNTAATQGALSRVTGGNVGGTVSALLGAQKLGGLGMNQAYGAAVPRATAMGNLAAEMSKEIAQRKLDIQHYVQQQKRAEAANMQQTGFGNFMAGISSFNKGGEDQSKVSNVPFQNMSSANSSAPNVTGGATGSQVGKASTNTQPSGATSGWSNIMGLFTGKK